MNTLQNYIEKFGNDFIVASLIPSLAFVSSGWFLFEDVWRDAFPLIIPDDIGWEGGISLLLVVTIILGFTLTSLNTFIYKLFEGYVFLHRLPLLRKFEVRRARKLKRIERNLSRKIDYLDSRNAKWAEHKKKSLVELRKQIATEIYNDFPFRDMDILPTRFGNILKAAEAYSVDRYNLDAVPIWPRMIQVIPKEYLGRINHSNNQLSFLMHCTLLSILFLFLNIFSLAYKTFFCTSCNSLPTSFMLLPFLAFIMIIVFWKASLLVVTDYGILIRSAFDLFRLDLIKQLHLDLPVDTEAEMDLWAKISDFVNIGHRYAPINFTYKSKKDINPKN